VLQVVLTLAPGGTERLVIELARRLHHRHGMSVCCLDEPGSWASEVEQAGIFVTSLRRRSGFVPSLGRRIAEIAGRLDVTVLHCHHYSPFVYGTLARLWRPLRVVYTEHGRLNDAPPSGKRWVANQVLGRLPAEISSVSDDLRSHMVAEGFSRRRVRVIHNGITVGPVPTSSRRAAARARLGVSEDEFVVGAVGRLDPVKDLTTLIDAFAEFRGTRRARLLLIGEGSERVSLERHVEDAGLSGEVVLLGHRQDVSDLLPGFDAYVNSSVFEGISLTILEAMAAGVPVVATRVGGTPEVVLHGVTGWLVPSRSPESIAAALREIAGNPGGVAALTFAGRQRVEHDFSIDRMVQRYASIYDRFEVR
jgi:glycosyltransferase involved in cell wall biosynthesis